MSGLGAQFGNPGAHFGARSIPTDGTAAYFGVTLNRFTPNGKPTDPGIYNGIDRTIGLNFLAYSVASRSERWPSLTYRTTLQLGWGHDQPTEWIQNSLHLLANKLPVASVNPRNNVLDAALDFELVQWKPLGRSAERFAGGGISVGTPYTEAWIEIGVASRFGGGWPEFAGMIRLGSPLRGGVFPDSTITRGYGIIEGLVEFPLATWMKMDRIPTFFISFQHHTGLFVDLAGEAIAERQGSFGFIGRDDAWRFEAWNEYFGGRFVDKGPTGGGRITVQVPRLGVLASLF
ncbi:MAG: hypothetical protein OEZ65_12210 [Gemmatimonadota bacterium]|nr:hypothetical protein [Gemmatimonadota bacterium]MDH5760344.1 hypothetical protein [Gemmatimonadota bacterium]